MLRIPCFERNKNYGFFCYFQALFFRTLFSNDVDLMGSVIDEVIIVVKC
jgi:hypothetical protein